MRKLILSLLLLFACVVPAFAGGQQTLVTPNGNVFGTSSNPLYVSGASPATALEVTTVASDADIQNNRNIWHSHSIVTFNGNQYIAYWNSTSANAGRIVGCKRAVNTETWTCYTFDGTGGRPNITGAVTATDDHNSIALGVDELGFLHLSYDEHSTALHYRVSTAAENISNFGNDLGSMVGTNETAVSYPVFFNDRNGALYFTFRDGAVDNADQYLYKYNSGTTTWAAAPGTGAAGKFISGKTSSPVSNAYVSIPYVSSNNIVRFAFSWETTSVPNEALDVSHVSYNATSGAFTKADGSSQTIPITLANDDNAVAIANDGVTHLGALITKHAAVSDSSGNIYIVYRKNDANAFSQVYVVIFKNGAWQTPIQLTNDSEPYLIDQVTNYGSARSPITLIDSRGTIYVLFPSTTVTNGLAVIETSDNFATWHRYSIFSGAFGLNKLSNFDPLAWRNSNELFLVTQNSGLDQSAFYTRRPINLIHWSPTRGKPSADVSGYTGFDVYDDLFLMSEAGKIFVKGAFWNDGGNYIIMDGDDTLTSAISKANAGDTIVLGSATYTECLNVTKSLHFVGQSRKGSVVTCNTADEDTFNVTASNVSFSNMTINNTGGGSVTNNSRGIMFDGTGGTILTGELVDNVDITVTGGSTGKVEGIIRANEANVDIYNSKLTGTSSLAATSIGIGMTGASTAEAAYTVNVYNSTISLDARSTTRGISVTDSTDSFAITFNGYNIEVTATENAASTTTGAITNTSTDASINLYRSRVSGADVDVNNAGGGVFTLNNTILVNNTFAGGITSAGGTFLRNVVLGDTIVSTRTTDLGWSVVSGANTACNTTCANACVLGFASAATGSDPVACTDATADNCLCAGSN